MMTSSVAWNSDELATLYARYATQPLDDLAKILRRSRDEIVEQAERLGLWRVAGVEDTMSRRGAERLAAVIAAHWADRGVRVVPKLISFRFHHETCWVIRLPPVGCTPPRRLAPVVRTRVRVDWPPGSNLELLQRQDAVRRRYFWNGAVRRGVSA